MSSTFSPNGNGPTTEPRRPRCPVCREYDQVVYLREEGWVCTRNHGGQGNAVEGNVLFDEDPEASTAKLRVLDTLAMLTTAPAPLWWLAEGVWCKGKLTLFGGREKRGKSLIQLVLAATMASGGGEVAGIEIPFGRALVIDAENGEEEIHRRLRAIGMEPAYADNLVVVEARGFDLRYDLQSVADLAENHGSHLVLLDSFRSLWRGDERDEGEAAAALDPVRDLAHDSEVAYSLVHHAQKGGDEYRGSSAIGACVDWVVMLDRDKEDPTANRRRLTTPLARFAPERPDRWLTIESDGDDGPVRLEESEPFERGREAPARNDLKEAIREGVRCTPSIGDTTPDTFDWTLADLARMVEEDPKNRTVRLAVEELVKEGTLQPGQRGKRTVYNPNPTLFDR